MQDLPVNLQEAIFSLCDLTSQHAMSQTCRRFWRFFHSVKYIPAWPDCMPEHYWTAYEQWHWDRTKTAAEWVADQVLRPEVDIKPLRNITLFPHHDAFYHASLVGHLRQHHLQSMLQPPKPLGSFSSFFAESAAHELVMKLEYNPTNAAQSGLFFFTLKVYHGRQAGFSDDELAKLGAVFNTLPYHIWSELVKVYAQPPHVMCGPIWQLVSPSGQCSSMGWDMQNSAFIHRVVELPELLGS